MHLKCSSGKCIIQIILEVLFSFKGRRMHAGSRYFGQPWKKGDVVGCMINMEDKSMIFTLNGELMITSKGSELAFADFETEDGECFIHTVSGGRTGFV